MMISVLQYANLIFRPELEYAWIFHAWLDQLVQAMDQPTCTMWHSPVSTHNENKFKKFGFSLFSPFSDMERFAWLMNERYGTAFTNDFSLLFFYSCVFWWIVATSVHSTWTRMKQFNACESALSTQLVDLHLLGICTNDGIGCHFMGKVFAWQSQSFSHMRQCAQWNLNSEYVERREMLTRAKHRAIQSNLSHLIYRLFDYLGQMTIGRLTRFREILFMDLVIWLSESATHSNIHDSFRMKIRIDSMEFYWRIGAIGRKNNIDFLQRIRCFVTHFLLSSIERILKTYENRFLPFVPRTRARSISKLKSHKTTMRCHILLLTRKRRHGSELWPCWKRHKQNRLCLAT